MAPISGNSKWRIVTDFPGKMANILQSSLTARKHFEYFLLVIQSFEGSQGEEKTLLLFDVFLGVIDKTREKRVTS